MSTTYEPSFPADFTPQQADWLYRELSALKSALEDGAPSIRLQELNAEPQKYASGDVVLADGTNWDPGSGAGFYGRYGGAWVKLG